jgi:hypothetical protein
MKRTNLIFIMTLLLSVVGCTSADELIGSDEDVSESEFSKFRSVDEALVIANSAFIPGSEHSRSHRLATASDVKVITSNKSRSGELDTLMYVVDHGNNEGFTIVAAPKNVVPVIAITESGDFDSEETESNESFQYALSAAKEYISIGRDTIDNGPVDFIAQFKTERAYLMFTGYKNLSTKWNQGWPENIYCSNNYAGCAPLAIAQTCAFFKEPTGVSLTFSGRDKDYQPLDWTDILKHTTSATVYAPTESYISSHLSSCEASDSSHYALARFIRQIGVVVSSSYESSGTWTLISKIPSTARYFMPNRTVTDCGALQTLYSYLDRSTILIVSGGSHCWIADGTAKEGYEEALYIYNEKTGKYDYDSTTEYMSYYIHHNWGWGGNCNGYFLDGIFDTSKGYVYDGDSTVSKDYESLISVIQVK